MTRTQKIIFWSILAVAIFLIFFRLTRHDMLGDDAHYAFRSIGYFDYMASNEQTTPVQWFGNRPWWSFLSFHDHPPLVFLIQYLFFKLFGISVFAARFPSALAAFGTVLILYFLGKRLGGISLGLLAGGTLALNNYFIWTGRVGLLESVFTFFLMLGFFYFFKGLEDGSKFFKLAWFYWGLSFLSKYTFLFVLPALLIYFLWKEREVFRSQQFWIGVLIFVILCLPVVIYNLEMYVTRGHFDVQFGDLFGQNHGDWTRLQNRISLAGWNPLLNLRTLVDGYSVIYFGILIMAFIVGSYFAWRKKKTWFFLPAISFIIVFLFFTLVGGAARWMGVLSPFAALVIAFTFQELSQRLSARTFRVTGQILISGIVIFSLFYILNTNHFSAAVGSKQWYADFRIENLGYNQLDRKIQEIVGKSSVPPLTVEAVRLWWYKAINQDEINFSRDDNSRYPSFNSMIIYDSNTSWFPTLWTFERGKFFKRFLMPSAEEYFKMIKTDESLAVLKELDLDGIYLVEAAPQVARESNIEFPEIKLLVQDFKNQDILPQIIYDDKGRAAFYIYHGSFK